MSDSETGKTARALLRAQEKGALATLMTPGGEPYGSLVIYAADYAGRPCFLLSDLAQHSINLGAGAAASLLVDGTGGLDDPLTGARLTLMGRIQATGSDGAAARFMERHPSARDYAGFGDFRWYRIEVDRAHLVAGFGQIDWIEAEDYLLRDAGAEPLAAAEAEIIDHMNNDHADTVQRYAASLLGKRGSGWRFTGIDPEGCDLRRGGEVARLDFDDLVNDSEGARKMLSALATEARSRAV